MKDGDLAILNCTDGDTRISFNSADAGEVERAKAVVEDMLRRGYCIAVVVGDKMERVKGFDPTNGEYIVEAPPPEALRHEPDDQAPKQRGGGRRGIPAKSARAVSVGPTAGGGLCCGHFPVDLRARARR